tara:strand:- start:164 stop:742 length:579 start_codon:yes stop_codon:yes gene_type:complete
MTTKIVYVFDENTKEYLFTLNTPSSPEEDGVFLIPRFCTEDAPAPAQKGYYSSYEGGYWTNKPDIRGCWYSEDNTITNVEDLSFSVPEGWTREPTPVSPTPLQLRNAALADITYIRPSDGAQIQIRHPDYASDYIIMTSAINMLAPLETRFWIVKDDQPVLVSREDLEAAIVFGSAEVDRIFVEYITALQGE